MNSVIYQSSSDNCAHLARLQQEILLPPDSQQPSLESVLVLGLVRWDGAEKALQRCVVIRQHIEY